MAKAHSLILQEDVSNDLIENIISDSEDDDHVSMLSSLFSASKKLKRKNLIVSSSPVRDILKETLQSSSKTNIPLVDLSNDFSDQEEMTLIDKPINLMDDNKENHQSESTPTLRFMNEAIPESDNLSEIIIKSPILGPESVIPGTEPNFYERNSSPIRGDAHELNFKTQGIDTTQIDESTKFSLLDEEDEDKTQIPPTDYTQEDKHECPYFIESCTQDDYYTSYYQKEEPLSPLRSFTSVSTILNNPQRFRELSYICGRLSKTKECEAIDADEFVKEVNKKASRAQNFKGGNSGWKKRPFNKFRKRK
ncbi:hypothetical protein O9G_000727 [Rozella allomycis CSF55]|uniref:Uncharacterized protein n=1 Tax=Rozella allomycis (strain CSF55) TaxID=988480 RepID=A0A075B2X9_ROZAC|nr:hypothetical protein O9G_000727 [Rozella allomycis CSF55]|eukprot:EPZ35331.1 hypothetical protein O9G_000727 [Rozella allomycis CSF55]